MQRSTCHRSEQPQRQAPTDRGDSPPDTKPQPLGYEPRPPKTFIRTRRTLLATAIIYLMAYVILRCSGVYYAYWSQGSWEIEGGTGILAVDLAFFPMGLIEDYLQNNLHLLKPPTGA